MLKMQHVVIPGPVNLDLISTATTLASTRLRSSSRKKSGGCPLRKLTVTNYTITSYDSGNPSVTTKFVNPRKLPLPVVSPAHRTSEKAENAKAQVSPHSLLGNHDQVNRPRCCCRNRRQSNNVVWAGSPMRQSNITPCTIGGYNSDDSHAANWTGQ